MIDGEIGERTIHTLVKAQDEVQGRNLAFPLLHYCVRNLKRLYTYTEEWALHLHCLNNSNELILDVNVTVKDCLSLHVALNQSVAEIKKLQ